ncbi:MAG TPA: hypothetical protein VFO11_01260 [Candidatus Polarisedimenticolaceae bacterium]|nr:hypothetical protein [Candidatus Polarisedimenticolaceae bacterium]
MTGPKVAGWVVGVLLPGFAAAAPYPVVQVPVFHLTCRVLSTPGSSSVVLSEGTVDLEPDRPGRLELDLPWDASGSAGLSLDALRQEAPEGGHRVHLEAVLRPPGGAPVRLDRSVDLTEGATALLELHRRAGRTLVLALEIEGDFRPVVGIPTGLGAPVLFHLTVERVSGAESAPLETNALHTLVGEGVEYAFRRGGGNAEETLRLRLTPVRVGAEVVEVDVELDGRLPGGEGPSTLRRDRLLATRGSTSSFDAVAGTPPAGYRFRIRPEF